MKKFWDERYGGDDYVYGTEPNQWYKEQIAALKPGAALFIAEGEGRNAVHAANLGWRVTAFDYSQNGRRKALALARSSGVDIDYTVADAAVYAIPGNHFDLMVMIYTHFPADVREQLFPKMIAGLRPGGRIIAEVFSTRQFGRNSGGPKSPDLMYTTEQLRRYFGELQIERMEEAVIHLSEGPHHEGEADVIRMIAVKKPAV